MNLLFEKLYSSTKSRARLGEIKTAHGVIKTPAFVPVATKGSIKALWPKLIKDIGVQVAFVNTYHLVTHPGTEIIRKAGGIHKFANFNIPLMSDSGGFQVFSLQNKKLNIKNKKDILKLRNIIMEIDIQSGIYRYDLSAVDENCHCYVCQNFTKSYLHHLFKQRELLGYSLATYHNLWVMESLMKTIRESISNNLI